MERTNFNVELTTPCFLGGASQTAEWRAASIRGQLRWWFRAVAGGAYQGDMAAVREAETALFGSTDQGSALRVRCSPSPRASKDLDLGPPMNAATLAALWGEPTPNTEKRLRILRDGRESPSNPIQYLGFGPIVGGKILRPFLPPGSAVWFRLQWLRRPADEKWTEIFQQALWAWLHLGGIGSRSRKGFGSLRLTSAPDGREELMKKARTLLALGHEATTTPEWTHFSRNSRIYLSKTPKKTWAEAMAQLGAWLIAFRRRYGYAGDTRMAGSLPLADRDYEWAAPHGRLGRQGIPDRSGFGLPLPFGQHETVTWDSKEGESRRASPLLLHIERFGDDYVPVLTYLPARFVPAGQSLLYRGGGKKFAPTPQVLNVVERFLDDLQGKKLIEVIS